VKPNRHRAQWRRITRQARFPRASRRSPDRAPGLRADISSPLRVSNGQGVPSVPPVWHPWRQPAPHRCAANRGNAGLADRRHRGLCRTACRGSLVLGVRHGRLGTAARPVEGRRGWLGAAGSRAPGAAGRHIAGARVGLGCRDLESVARADHATLHADNTRLGFGVDHHIAATLIPSPEEPCRRGELVLP
jgi:hypothetical protein